MTTKPEVSKESVVLLCKGGYLPSRDHLTPDEREANKEHHVELMLRTAREHRMRRLEGFQFVAPPQPWERFWIVEFPEFEGAEAYAEAEMALPSGPHAYHEYYMARRWGREYYDAWVANPREPIAPLPDAPDVDGQRKCPAKWPAKMSLVLLAMITDGSYSTRSRFMGGLRASMYFFAVSRWMPSSRATPRVDNPLRFAF